MTHSSGTSPLVRRLAVLAATGAVVLASCQDATAVRVHVYTDVAWQTGRRLVIAAATEAPPSPSEPLAEVTEPWNTTDLGDFVLLPSRSKRAPIRLAVVMGITKDPRTCSIDAPDGCIFVRRKLGFVEHRTLTVPVTVYSTCIGIPCTPDTTCNALGQCVSADIDPNTCASPDGCFLPGEGPPSALHAPDAGADLDAGVAIDALADVDSGAIDAGGDATTGVSLVGRLSLGLDYSCARFNDGRVKCWGRNFEGQLGLGNTTTRGDQPGEMGTALPFVSLGTGRSARAIAAGLFHACALLDNDQIKCWGNNLSGRLGLGDTTSRGTNTGQMGDALPFVNLGTGRSAHAITAGWTHTCALLDNDQIKCWGDNEDGTLGLGDTEDRGDAPGEMGDALPFVDLGSGRSARAIMTAWNHTCAILDNGQVKCWGANANGQLGLGDTASRGDAPGEMGDALPFVNLGTGRSARALATSEKHTCAILDNDQVKCWGGSSFGIGLGDSASRGDNPGEMGDALPFVNLGTGRSARALATGGSHTCALLDTDQIKCWGYNSNGQLGLGDTASRGDNPGEMSDALPSVDLGPGRSARAVATGGHYTCALLDTDQIKCWGYNNVGQLGLGDTQYRGDQPGEMGDALPFVDLGK